MSRQQARPDERNLKRLARALEGPTLLALALVLDGPARAAAAPPAVQRHTLPNGLEILVAENHAQPLVTIEVAVKNGSMNESPAYSGTAHLYEHLFCEGNEIATSRTAFSARLRQLGIEYRATTATERVTYAFTTSSRNFREAMRLLRDSLVFPGFDDESVARQRVVVIEELDRNEAEPFHRLTRLTEARVWWKYPTRKNPLGARARIRAVTARKMRTIHERYYLPNNAVLVVTGAVAAAEVVAQAAELYGLWDRGPNPFERFPLVQHPPIPRTEVVLLPREVTAVSGLLTWHGPSTGRASLADAYAADLLAAAVNQGASAFQKRLVGSGACLDAQLRHQSQKSTGLLTIRFEARTANADVCLEAISAELARMGSSDYLSEAEMKSALAAHDVEVARTRERPGAFAHELTSWWAAAGVDHYLGYPDSLARVTRADIARLLETYVLGKPFVLGLVLAPGAIAGGLDRGHFERLIGARSRANRAPEVGPVQVLSGSQSGSGWP